MGLFTNGLFGGGGFGGLGMGGSQMWGTAPGVAGTMQGGQAFNTGLTSDMLTGAMNSSTPGQVQGLYNQYGATEFGNAAAGMTGADQNRLGSFATNNPSQLAGVGSNVATMQGGTPATQGMLTGTGESFNNAARTGLLGYVGINNVQNANEGMDIMNEQQDLYTRQANEDYANDQATQQLNF